MVDQDFQLENEIGGDQGKIKPKKRGVGDFELVNSNIQKNIRVPFEFKEVDQHK